MARTSPTRSITPTVARRLAITKQRLAGPRPRRGPAGVLEVIRDLRCLQLDPISAVARSPLLVLRSRLEAFDPGHLDALLWKDRVLLEYWAHAASIVLTEDYPIHRLRMRGYLTGNLAWERRTRAWVAANRGLTRYILAELRRRGPLRSRDLEDRSAQMWRSTGWTHNQNVGRMLGILWGQGRILVAGRTGGEKRWDLAARWLPDWTPRRPVSGAALSDRAAELSLRGLGVGRPIDIQRHFIRDWYPDLPGTLERLRSRGRIEPVRIEDDGRAWPGRWFVHTEDLPLLERLASGAGGWEPRTTLLSTFDNLIADRARTRFLFEFDFTLEIYVPARQRRFGYYVLPLLHGDRLIARMDAAFDRSDSCLAVHSVHAEREAPTDRATGRAAAAAVEDLAAWLGAGKVSYGERLPEGWRLALR